MLKPLRAGNFAALTSSKRVEGHGPMQDMAVHPAMGAVLVAMPDNSRKIVAALCRGPAGPCLAFEASYPISNRAAPNGGSGSPAVEVLVRAQRA